MFLQFLFLFTLAAFTRVFCWLIQVLLLISSVCDVLFTSTQQPAVMASRSNLRLLCPLFAPICVCISNWRPGWFSVHLRLRLLPVLIYHWCFPTASPIHDAYILPAPTYLCRTPLTIVAATFMADSSLWPGLSLCCSCYHLDLSESLCLYKVLVPEALLGVWCLLQ